MNENAKHTQAKWDAQSRSMSDGALVVKDSEFNEICVIREKLDRHYRGEQEKTDQANAALIASAPDLLAALDGVVRVADRATDEFDAARAAIKRARGE